MEELIDERMARPLALLRYINLLHSIQSFRFINYISRQQRRAAMSQIILIG